jgi:hypothetical protein
MPDTEILDIPLSGINPDLQLSLNSGKLTHDPISRLRHREKPEKTYLFPLRTGALWDPASHA